MVKIIYFVGIYREIISHLSFLGGAKWISQPSTDGGYVPLSQGAHTALQAEKERWQSLEMPFAWGQTASGTILGWG